jgi:hypothetical protein
MSQQSVSWTQRIGGNRTLVLGIIITILVVFTVETYIVQAFGIGGRGGEYVRFTVNGRAVAMDEGRYKALQSDWHRYQQGLGRLTGRQRGGNEDFLMDLMLAEMARDAGLSVPDATLREYIKINPLFADSSGEFDAAKFEAALKEQYGGLRTKAFEEQARNALLVAHFVTLYDQAYRIVNDDEAWARWKGDSPKVGVAYTWAGTSAIRAGMKVEDLTAGEVEEFWKGAAVKARHRLPPRYEFEAAAVTVQQVDGNAYRDARAEWKDDPDLRLRKDQNVDEGWDHFLQNVRTDYDIAQVSPETVDALRAENEAEVKKEDEEAAKGPGGVAPKPGPTDPNSAEAPPDLSKLPPDKLDQKELYRRYWRHRVEKQLWLKKLLAKIVRVATEEKITLAAAAEKWSRPGVRFRIHVQDTPVDQYGVEGIKGFGSPNCDLRYTINESKKEDEGRVHPGILSLVTDRHRLDETGWLAYRLTKYHPDEEPPLDRVREKVSVELLDERSREKARTALEELRKAAEDAKRPLEEVAKEKGFECAAVGPFNAYSWRPPAPKPAVGVGLPEVNPTMVEAWKEPSRRQSAIMGRYSAMRELPVGAFTPVLEDYSGTGAFYLAQVKSREEPVFEEMTQDQKTRMRRTIGRERLSAMSQELGYGRLKDRLGLKIAGEPAPEPESLRRGR